MDLASGQATQIGLQEVSTGTAPLWSPDGKRFVFLHRPRGPADLMIQTVDGGAPEVLYRSEAEFNNPMSWSPDGRVISIESPGRETGWDVWALPVDGDRKPTALVRGQFNEGGGWFSPDGRWLAYYSDETGGNQIYVQPYPAHGARSVVPGSASRSGNTGGFWWSHDGREIVFDMGDGSIRAAAVVPGPAFRCSPPHVLFEMGDNVLAVSPAPDHRRFLAVVRAEAMTAPAIVADLHWAAGLRKP
jgi:serine/threonine-protein kinase